jgi:hypothetical protein
MISPAQQRRARSLPQLRNLQRHRRLREMEFHRRAGDASHARHSLQRFQLTKGGSF